MLDNFAMDKFPYVFFIMHCLNLNIWFADEFASDIPVWSARYEYLNGPLRVGQQELDSLNESAPRFRFALIQSIKHEGGFMVEVY